MCQVGAVWAPWMETKPETAKGEMMTEKCTICGEPVPEGETMFKFHGYSGPCPKPPLKKERLDPAGQPKAELTVLERKAVGVLSTIKAAADGGLIQLPVDMQIGIDVVLMAASVRRIGVA